jgi:hypothetical protein
VFYHARRRLPAAWVHVFMEHALLSRGVNWGVPRGLGI